MRFQTWHESWLALVATGLLAAVLYFGVVLSGDTAAQQIHREIAETQAMVDRIPVLEAEQQDLKRRLNQQIQRLADLEDRVPAQLHVADILHQIACLAGSSGLTISRMEPLPSVEHHSYSDHPFQLTCCGTFDDLSKFLNGLETQSRLVTFGEVELAMNAEHPNESATPAKIQANLQVTVYSRQAKSTKIAENTASRGFRSSDK